MALPVIFNPHSGKKRALRRLKELQRQCTIEFDLRPTEEPGQAEELALAAAEQGHAVIAAAGGDGTVHEVANGLLRATNGAAALAILPIGSANDYYHSLQLEGLLDKKEPFQVDVGHVREPAGKQRHFVCCLGLGFNGQVTREARRIRGLQGMPLYGLATLRALLWHFRCSPMTLKFDDKSKIEARTLMASVLVGKREGGFLMAPDARMDDGWFDYVHAGRLSRWQIIRLLPRLALWGAPKNYPGITLGRCRILSLESEEELTVHLDGEFFCEPGDNVRQLEIEIQPKRLTIHPNIISH